MGNLDFNHLRLLAIYACVVENGSFAAAARKLHSSRSRVSEQIAQLEKDLGTRLLQRSTRQLTMTQEGQRVYAEAQALPATLNRIEAIAKPQRPSGRVAITVSHDIAHKFLLPRLADLQQCYPDIRLDLILDDRRLDLIDEQIDLAIRVGLPQDDSVVARILHEESFAIYASPQYLQQRGTPETLQQLQQHRWVLLQQTSHDNVIRLRQHGHMIDIRPSSYYRCNSPLMLQHMVARGLGLGVMLPTSVRQELSEHAVTQVMPSISSEPLVFALMYPSRRQLPQRTRAVIDYLLNARLFQ